MTSYQHIYIWLKCRQLWGVGQMGEREREICKLSCVFRGGQEVWDPSPLLLFVIRDSQSPLLFFGTSSWGVLVC